MKRLVTCLVALLGVLPVVFACTFNFCTGAHQACTDWDDCWPGNSYYGHEVSQYFWCQIQGNECCYCHEACYDCCEDAYYHNPGGYKYARWQHTVLNGTCATEMYNRGQICIPPPGGGG